MNYLYNGVELPALPEWDKETYPYALIYKSSFGGHVLFLTDVVGTYTSSVVYYNGVRIDCDCAQGETEWSDFSDAMSFERYIAASTHYVWANYDILKGDGTLYLAASDPIPVTAPALDPLSMWLGWKAGNWVARQRGKKVEPPEEEKTPVAYLYNGVRLPDINTVWTDERKALYPYAYMFEVAGFGAYDIILASFEMYKDGKQIFAKTAGESIFAMYLPGAYDDWKSDGIAEEVKENEIMFDEEAESQIITAVIWTSHDILNSDGTIYLAASEPVPVYA